MNYIAHFYCWEDDIKVPKGIEVFDSLHWTYEEIKRECEFLFQTYKFEDYILVKYMV